MIESPEILILSIALLFAVWMIEFGDSIKTYIRSIWAKIWASDDPGVLFTVALCTWAAGLGVYCWVVG